MAMNPLHEVDSAPDHPTPVRETSSAESAIETALHSLIDLHGPSLLFESDRLAGDLRERCPDAEREIPVLRQAQDEQVPQQLLSAHTDEDLQNLLPRLAKQLSARKGLTPAASAWAVRTWARGLGLPVFATGVLPERLYTDAVVKSSAVPSARSWITMGTVLVAAIALVATGFAPFHAPSVDTVQPAGRAPPIDREQRPAEIARVAGTPPIIAAIAAPHPIVAGKPSTLTIVYADGQSNVAQIERKVIDSTAPWPSHATVTKMISELPSPKAGTVTYPLEAINAPLRSTVEFALIDRDGVRSQARRIVLDVVRSEPRRAPRVSRDAAPQARVASRVCTSATCGRIVAVRAMGIGSLIGRGGIEGSFVAASSLASAEPRDRPAGRREKTYEVTVLTDNGTTHLLTQTARWKKGARVRVIANTIAAVDG